MSLKCWKTERSDTPARAAMGRARPQVAPIDEGRARPRWRRARSPRARRPSTVARRAEDLPWCAAELIAVPVQAQDTGESVLRLTRCPGPCARSPPVELTAPRRRSLRWLVAIAIRGPGERNRDGRSSAPRRPIREHRAVPASRAPGDRAVLRAPGRRSFFARLGRRRSSGTTAPGCATTPATAPQRHLDGACQRPRADGSHDAAHRSHLSATASPVSWFAAAVCRPAHRGAARHRRGAHLPLALRSPDLPTLRALAAGRDLLSSSPASADPARRGGGTGGGARLVGVATVGGVTITCVPPATGASAASVT